MARRGWFRWKWTDLIIATFVSAGVVDFTVAAAAIVVLKIVPLALGGERGVRTSAPSSSQWAASTTRRSGEAPSRPEPEGRGRSLKPDPARAEQAGPDSSYLCQLSPSVGNEL
jgi:hypothetical protein